MYANRLILTPLYNPNCFGLEISSPGEFTNIVLNEDPLRLMDVLVKKISHNQVSVLKLIHRDNAWELELTQGLRIVQPGSKDNNNFLVLVAHTLNKLGHQVLLEFKND